MGASHHREDVHSPSKIWSPTFQKKVTHFPNNGPHPQWSPGWSNTIPMRVTNNPKVCHTPTQRKPPTIITEFINQLFFWFNFFSKIYKSIFFSVSKNLNILTFGIFGVCVFLLTHPPILGSKTHFRANIVLGRVP